VNFKARILVFAFCLTVMVLPPLTARAFYAAVSQATVFVDPAKVTAGVNETIQIRVNISDVSNLQGFDFMLAYDSRVLNCSNLEEGSFMSEFGPTFVAKLEIDNSFSSESGRVWFAVAILGKGWADGNGTLAVISFETVAAGQTVLNLYSDYPLREDQVKLSTCASEAIPSKAIDGLVVVTAAGTGDSADPPPNDHLISGPLSPDVNGDGVIDILDFSVVARACGAVNGDSRYNAKADLDQNGIVDIRDVALVARSYARGL
jgi:hypothetical protein